MPPIPEAPADAPPCVVLDTNVVLDWLSFGDPRCQGLDTAIRAGAVRWVGTAAMREELEHVLTREPFSSRPETVETVLATVGGVMTLLDRAPATAGPAGRCTDPDDQKFIDLALHLGAPAQLVSRDRAVLRLARAAARHGVLITSIAGWRAPAPTLGG